MYVNGQRLLKAAPIKNMLSEKVRHNGVSHGLAEAGYDIRIAETIVFDATHSPFVTVNDETTGRRFTIASAMEEFDMPANLVAYVKDKSTWARQGLSVFNTVIEPNWKGFLTLELVYHNDGILKIPAGTGIAQVLFASLYENAYYAGKYQNQSKGAQKAIIE